MRTTDDRRVDAARLSEMLGVRVGAVEILDETSGSANRLRLRLQYAEKTDLPERMFLKRHLADFNFPVEMYSTEVRIYRYVLPRTKIEQPAVYAVEAAPGDAEFAILMEDLSLRRDTRVGFVLDPATPDDVDSLLDTLAGLHSTWWGDDRLSRELPWLTTPTTNAPMRFWAEIGPRLTRRHLREGHRAELVDKTRWPQEQWWRAFAALLAANETGPHTLLHGDVHASNVYYRDTGPGGLLDWQLALRGCWALDVTYLMITALTPDDRRTHEAELLRGYLNRLRAAGVAAPAFDEAWLRYRQNALYGVLMWLITPDGVHTVAAQTCFLQRCLTAAEDLEMMRALSQ
jgi:aminoglycoside phosphotransferase (APT) family kinase protein